MSSCIGVPIKVNGERVMMQKNKNSLQLVQNVAAVLIRTRLCDHITPIFYTIHWLPIKLCLYYNIVIMTYKALNDLEKRYLNKRFVFCELPHLLWWKGAGCLLVPRIMKNTAGDLQRPRAMEQHSYKCSGLTMSKL